MAFQQGLSGLNAASRNLDVIGNNIANANTVVMKSSRAEFAELFAASNSSATTTGLGATVAAVTQSFTQGRSLIHISDPTRPLSNSYAVFRLKNKNKIS